MKIESSDLNLKKAIAPKSNKVACTLDQLKLSGIVPVCVKFVLNEVIWSFDVIVRQVS